MVRQQLSIAMGDQLGIDTLLGPLLVLEVKFHHFVAIPLADEGSVHFLVDQQFTEILVHFLTHFVAVGRSLEVGQLAQLGLGRNAVQRRRHFAHVFGLASVSIAKINEFDQVVLFVLLDVLGPVPFIILAVLGQTRGALLDRHFHARLFGHVKGINSLVDLGYPALGILQVKVTGIGHFGDGHLAGIAQGFVLVLVGQALGEGGPPNALFLFLGLLL